MSKTLEKEIKLEVNLPHTGFSKALFFNRLRVDRDEGFCLVQFGLVVASDLVDSYCCVLTNDVLQQNQKTLVEYSNKLVVNGSAEIWKGISASRKVDVADIVAMSFRGQVAETCFFSFSMCSASRFASSSSTGTPLPSQPLALLRSSVALQKQLITFLYEE